eukprot:CAMPEP_0205921890 /NCGR_PEP_ID=MMETSP1325-20131115/13588_1 /ASSEMBLY_ACC=CAM_ASM_000708 /TAXON_ID=236786 /ORGANISM="Florenciella sp., Strain RCC1007" /LENGTH=71 /DNA_ID=CAMNT_0053289811 /DNA_START=191 /DNA_END=404 /DNA_ORIENTATION=-
MSSDKESENLSRRKSKGSSQGQSAQGEPAPKARATAVADGNQVNIPEPVRSDDHEVLFLLIGLEGRLDWSG